MERKGKKLEDGRRRRPDTIEIEREREGRGRRRRRAAARMACSTRLCFSASIPRPPGSFSSDSSRFLFRYVSSASCSGMLWFLVGPKAHIQVLHEFRCYSL
jgi:hypothetical protein